MGDRSLPFLAMDVTWDEEGALIHTISYHPSNERMMEHKAMSSRIKELSADFHLDRVNGRITFDEYKRRMQYIWLPTVYQLIRSFGKTYVFPDIRYALNDVETELGLEVTVFEDDLVRYI